MKVKAKKGKKIAGNNEDDVRKIEVLLKHVHVHVSNNTMQWCLAKMKNNNVKTKENTFIVRDLNKSVTYSSDNPPWHVFFLHLLNV